MTYVTPTRLALAVAMFAIVATTTGCRCAMAVSLGGNRPTVAVLVAPKDYDGNSLQGAIDATLKAPGSL